MPEMYLRLKGKQVSKVTLLLLFPFMATVFIYFPQPLAIVAAYGANIKSLVCSTNIFIRPLKSVHWSIVFYGVCPKIACTGVVHAFSMLNPITW